MSERVLVIQPYGIGDAIFMFPLLRAIHEQLRPEGIDIVVGSRTRTIFESLPYVRDIFVIDKDEWKSRSKIGVMSHKLALLTALRRRRYTLCIDVSMQVEYSFWAWFYLRIPVRAGFDFKRRQKFLNRKLVVPDEGFQVENMVAWYADLGRLFGVEIRDPRPALELSPRAIEEGVFLRMSRGGAKNARYVVVVPGGGKTWGADARIKQWPVKSYAELLRLLRSDIDFDEVVVLGSADERPLGDELSALSPRPVVNLCGATDLIQATAVISGARLYIGNDGGLTHLAATQDVPVVAFYGPVDPDVYGPYPPHPRLALISRGLDCQPCYRGFRYNSSCRDIACLAGFSAEAVYRRLKAGFIGGLPS